MKINEQLQAVDLSSPVERALELAEKKVRALNQVWDPAQGAPVITVDGKYTSRSWTEWTQGFQFGCPLLIFEATGQNDMLQLGRSRTIEHMARHITHRGVHDHGFNTISTYGNLRRLMRLGRIESNDWEQRFYEMAIKASGAVQAARWTDAADDKLPCGYIYSFNGPHSLFVDTIRSLRILGLAHQLGHVLLGENDRQISLLGRLLIHGLTTARHIIWSDDQSGPYVIKGRTAHEAIFNTHNGGFRCRSTQQGYSPFSTWTRGLAWAILGFAEQLEFIETLSNDHIELQVGMEKKQIAGIFRQAACDTSDHYIDQCTATDGIPYWDDGAPGLYKLGDWRDKEADPLNDFEPVDSSAAAIAAQGLIRLGLQLGDAGSRYTQAGLTVAATLFGDPYLSLDDAHHGLLLHSVYHRPNGWDHIPKGRKIPCGESSMWGDYHALELAVLIQSLAQDKAHPVFFDRIGETE